jgi:hypothetical protein
MKLKNLLMKVLFVAFGLCVGQSVWADETTVGNADNSSTWFTAFSSDYTLADNQKLYLEFTNYTSDYVAGTWKDWFNWVIIVKNDQDGHSTTDNSNYAEYFGMNSANNSWGARSVAENLYCQNYVWLEANQKRMNGANVKMTITRENGRVSIYALMSNTTQEGTETSPTPKSWSESSFFDLPAEAASQNIRVFLSVEKAHIVIDNSKTATTPTTAGYYTVGTTAKDALFFSAFSDYYSVPANQTMKLHFKNYSLKGGNYQNWIAVLTNNKKRGVEGYAEYLVLRNDNYGWGTKYGAGTLTSNFAWDYDPKGTTTDGEKFRDEMDGSDVVMSVTRSGATFTVYADITASDGTTKRYEQFVGTCDANEELYFFLTTELGYLSVQSLETKAVTAAGWATYCSPYALDLQHATGLTDAYIVTGGEDGVLTKTSVKGGTVPANTGLLLKADEGAVSMPIVGTSTTDISANKLIGTTETFNLTAETGYVLMATGSNGLGFYKNANAFTVGANTAYLPAGFATDGAREFFSLDDDATAISEAKSQQPMANGLFFDLQGRKVAQPQKGLYIVNGKKVVMK